MYISEMFFYERVAIKYNTCIIMPTNILLFFSPTTLAATSHAPTNLLLDDIVPHPPPTRKVLSGHQDMGNAIPLLGNPSKEIQTNCSFGTTSPMTANSSFTYETLARKDATLVSVGHLGVA